MEYQVRTYKIAEGRMDEWLSGWSEGVRPLREQLGFRVVGAWSLIETNEFVWVLAYDGPDSFEAANLAYYESADRADLDPDPAQHIVAANEVMATPI